MTQLLCVDPAEVHKLWPAIRERVWVSLVKGVGGLFQEIERDILSGNALVWLAVAGGHEIRGVCVTQLVQTDQGLKCFIRVVSGTDMREWFPHLKEIERFATNEGCVSMQVEGRKGWSRMLKDYAQTGVILEKELR